MAVTRPGSLGLERRTALRPRLAWQRALFLAILVSSSVSRDAQAASFWGPATFGDHWGLSTLGRKGVADGAPIGTSAAGGLRPNARSLAESECYEIMSPRVQQVAMMFLITDTIYPENIWTDWLLPTSLMVHPDIECDAQVKKCYTEHVLMKPARSVYDEQGFFTFYVHSKPDAPPFKEGSIFYQREVKDRVQTEWGHHSLSQATRRLLQAALGNPLNQRFVLLCGTTIPVRPAHFTYSQLIGARRSRFDHLNFGVGDQAYEADAIRHPIALQEEWPEYAKHATGHGQWWVLIREHAEIVNGDTFVERLFNRHCFTTANERHDVEARQWCISDEQYVGTVLSKALGQQLRAVLVGDDPATLNWASGSGIKAEDITIDLILKARNAFNMSSEDLESELSPEGKWCHAAESPQWRPMILNHWWDQCGHYHIVPSKQDPVVDTIAAYPHCPLFVRKFKEQAVEELGPLLQKMRITSRIKDHHW